MINQILLLLARNKSYRLVVLSALVSGIGSGLSQVAVFGELTMLSASPLVFTSAFALSMIPGIFSSAWGAKLVSRFSALQILGLAEVIGALTLIIPILGAINDSIPLLLISQIFPAILSGLIFPVMQQFTRAQCKPSDLATVSVLESYVFSTQVVLGFGVGTILYAQIGAVSYFTIDVLSYLISALFIFMAAKHTFVNTSTTRAGSSSAGHVVESWELFSPVRRRAFLLLPLLSIFGTPAMALLPVIGMSYGKQIAVADFILTPSLLLIFMKVLGQLIGPLLLTPSAIEKHFSSNRTIILCGAGYVSAYLLASLVGSLPLASVAIIIAHIFSNVIYVIATYSAKTSFNEKEIAVISSRQYQIQLVAITTLSLVSGTIAEHVSVYWGILSGIPLVALTLLAVQIRVRSKKLKVIHGC
jgi:MFS family permease